MRPFPPIDPRAVVALILVLATASACGRPANEPAPPAAPSVQAPAPAAAAAPDPAAVAAPTVGAPSLPDAPAAATATKAAAPSKEGPPLRTFDLPLRAQGGGAAVATAHPLATRAAAGALHRGGNAIDALVAASFVLSVVTPQSTGIGGGGFAIVAPASGAATAWDFREAAPSAGALSDYLDAAGKPVAARSQRHGLAVGVPGLVAGLWTLHQRYGKRPWAELLQPAIDAAERGFAVGEALHDATVAVQAELDGSALALVAPGGQALVAGDVLRQPAQAETLRAIAARGSDGFYKGPVAADLVATVAARGGKLSLQDLAGYQVREVAPLAGRIFGFDALTMPQPSAGGAQLLAMAEFLQAHGRKAAPAGKAAPIDAADAHALVEAMRASYLLRLAYSGDPGKGAARLDDVYPVASRRKLLRGFSAAKAGTSTRIAVPGGKLENHDNTSHVSIIDQDGMAVASTHTINLLFGAGIVGSQSGVWLNNELDDFSFAEDASNAFGLAGSKANMFRPLARPVSSMSPVVLRDSKAGVRLVAGSPGGTRIPTAVLQVIWRHLVAGQPLDGAVQAGRVHHQAFPDEVWIEPGQANLSAALGKLGHTVVEKARWCNVQAIGRTAQQGQWVLEAVSDGRGEGGAMALPRL